MDITEYIKSTDLFILYTLNLLCLLTLFFRGISKIVREPVFVLIPIEDVCAFMASIHGMMHGEKHRDK